METHPGERVVKEKFPNTRKPSHQQVCGEFWNLRGQHNWEEKQIKPTDYMPNHNPRGEVALMLASTISKQGLNREVRVACLG